MSRIHFRTAALCLGLALVTLAAYSNHFGNAFHFDDFHTITGNIFVRDLHNIPRFFTGAALSSSTPDAATYRPVTSASLALDYWLGGGFDPFWFHLSTFLWFEVQLILMFLLFRRLMDLADPQPSNLWTALLASALYGLHPANAETVNYIIQRGRSVQHPGSSGQPVVVHGVSGAAEARLVSAAGGAGIPGQGSGPDLSADPAGVCFPFRAGWRPQEMECGAAGNPAGADRDGGRGVLTAVMTPPRMTRRAVSPWLYRSTQPWVALHYFQSFFLPTGLSADTDWTMFRPSA